MRSRRMIGAGLLAAAMLVYGQAKRPARPAAAKAGEAPKRSAAGAKPGNGRIESGGIEGSSVAAAKAEVAPPTAEELAANLAIAAQMDVAVETSMGSFRFALAPEKAPKHVAHFLRNMRAGVFDGNAFFRAVPGGIIQGGDPLVKEPKQPRELWGSGGLNLLPDEFSDYKHEAGTVSAVRIPGRTNSGGTQFFVCAGPQPPLDGQYSAFGRVSEGLEVVDKISRGATGEGGQLLQPVRVERVHLVPKRVEPFATASVAELQRTVTIETTVGRLRAKMRPDWAPETVRNFLKLAAAGWYDRTGFHRLAKGFVLQGGMGNTRENGEGHYAERWVKNLKGEFRSEVKHQRGTLSMARGEDPDSGSTSFFVVLGQAAHLDGQYAAFGEVVEGLEVLDRVETLAVNGENPVERLGLVKITVE